MGKPRQLPTLAFLTLLASITDMTSTAADALSGIHYDRIPSDAFSVVAEVRAKPGKEAQLRAATLPLIALVRGDPKNLVYFLQEDRDSPGHFIFYEVFATQADFEAHNNMAYVKAWFAKLPALADGSVQTLMMEVLANPKR
jgi:quinol monooxygenase YgiN